MTRRLTITALLAALIFVLCQVWAFSGEMEMAPPPASTEGIYTQWETFTTADGLPHDKVFAVFVDKDGKVWCGTEHGLARLDPSTKKFDVWHKEDGLAFESVSSIYVDDDGVAWIGTLQGLSRFDGKTFTNYFQPHEVMTRGVDKVDEGLINNVVYGVTKYGDDVWIATTDGTSRFNTKTGKWKGYYLHNSPMEETWCYGLNKDEEKGKLYISPWGGGMMEYDYATDHWQAYHDPDGSFVVDMFQHDGPLSQMSTSVAPDDTGAIWLASYFGVSRYDGTRWFEYSQSQTGIPSNFLNFVRGKGAAGFCCTDKGLGSFNFETQKWINYKRLEGAGSAGMIEIRSADGKLENQLISLSAIPHNFVWAVDFKGDNEIWVGTSKGLGHGMME
ncbi:two-component regulator propeller domain-containing protein [Acidobacteriota bacterium]